MSESRFVEALEALSKAKKGFILAESNYRALYASHWLASEQKTADARKYEADKATITLRIERDVAQAFVEQAEHVVLHLRGRESL